MKKYIIILTFFILFSCVSEDKIVKKQENTSSISTISDQEMEQKQKKSTISEVKKWSTYNKSNTYSTIPNDYVNSIYQDQLGNMWFATK
jgi:hypothetical protein